MKIDLTVEFLDGTTEQASAMFADFVAFERTWQRSVAKFEQELRLTDLGWLAWSCLTRAGKTRLKFDPDWTTTVADVRMAEDSENPLEKTLSEATPPIG